MKKMLPATALALLITGCSTDVYCSKQTAAVAPKETITYHFFTWNWAEETVDAAKICGGAENVVKTETQQNICKWIARFYYFRHLYSGWKRVCIAHNTALSCPSIWANSSVLLINILLWVPSSCFCIVTSLLRVK